MRGQERGGRRPPCCRGAEEGGQETRGEAREEKVKSERKEDEKRVSVENQHNPGGKRNRRFFKVRRASSSKPAQRHFQETAVR